MSNIQSYKDLLVWQKSMELFTHVYEMTTHFPAQEKYGPTSQMRRCSFSIPSNIAEGSKRGTRKDYRNFILIAYGSCAELETQALICTKLKICDSHLTHSLGSNN